MSAPAWRPIDKDTPRQVKILLWAVTSTEPPNWKMATGYCSINFDGELEWEWEGRLLKSYDTKPTHWMPLPNPPAADAPSAYLNTTTTREAAAIEIALKAFRDIVVWQGAANAERHEQIARDAIQAIGTILYPKEPAGEGKTP